MLDRFYSEDCIAESVGGAACEVSNELWASRLRGEYGDWDWRADLDIHLRGSIYLVSFDLSSFLHFCWFITLL
jgi:hypothetical protein